MTPQSAAFITRVACEQLDAQHWRLLNTLRYSNGPDYIVVPAGFVTDFASTPQIVWTLGMPRSGEYDSAAALHDYLYECGGRVRHAQAPEGSWAYRQYSKPEADRIFEQAMELLGVSAWKRSLMYRAVRVFGRGRFSAPPPQDAAGLPIGEQA